MNQEAPLLVAGRTSRHITRSFFFFKRFMVMDRQSREQMYNMKDSEILVMPAKAIPQPDNH
ncbi:hypothetical protein DRO03_07775 [Methanosarcinales archaeon]|nr:MAG: hypothetical protein DRO03_07775 [Methanosarcinales archaeon]